jgi:hypothetical protein
MKRLRVLLAFVGVVTVGALTTPLFRPKDDVTVAQLRDAGLLDCEPGADMLCDVRVSEEMAARLADAGRGNGKRYHRVGIDVRMCGDGGVVITDRRLYDNGKWRDGITLLEGSCSIVADAGLPDDPIVRTVNQDCACRKATGLCRYTLPDAGLAQLPLGITGGPPTLVGGAGCVRKSCTVLAGAADDSWPSECPQ